MSRRKKKSVVLPKAEKRLSGMKSINPKLDFGKGRSNAAFNNKINEVRAKLDTYNTLLSTVDAAYNDFIESEKELATLSEKMLANVGVEYGKDSTEYEMAGGVRRSERRRSSRRSAVETATA